jgi:hypothetical protein
MSSRSSAVGRLIALDAGCDHHVEPLDQKLADHGGCARRVVRGIAVHQNVDVGFDVVEHPPHHMAFALIGLAAHDGAGGAGYLHCLVG